MFPRSHFSFACVGLCAPSRSSKMDASSLAAAALAVAMEDSRSAAVREVMLDRERAAMVAEDRSSYIAQRHFVGSQQEPNSHVHPMPWREAYMVRSTDMMRAREVMRASLMVLRRGDAQRAREVMARILSEIIGYEEGESEEEDVVVEDFSERARSRSPRR